ncbi:MAG: ABC transporter permease [Cytophagales bacterium]|nr:ABC transporter permease [Cytophagales bacterium]
MLKNYLLIAFRTMIRQKAYSFINLSGLAIGIAACILILLYVQYELSYETYLRDHERIYRISRSWLNADGRTNLHLGHLAPPFSPLLKMDYKGIIEESVRLLDYDPLISANGKKFEEHGFFFADPEFLSVFSWSMIRGDPVQALAEPNAIVLTESTAKKYFGDEDPLGKTMNYNNTLDLKVTGILEDIPENSHLHPTMFAPMVLVEEYYGGREHFMSAWGSNNFSTFVKLYPDADAEEFEKSLAGFIDNHFDVPETGRASDYNKLQIMNIADIHLHSHLDSEIEQNGDIAYVSLFAFISGFILVIACINYVNLATARSSKRAREVGIRKVMGAYRRRLFGQFLSESMLFAALALIIACFIAVLLLPWFNDFSQRQLEFNLLENQFLLYLLLAITIVTGFIAGIYPAIFLSAFQPATVLKGVGINAGKGMMRSALVVFQFFISIVMLIGVGVVYDQLNYLKSKDLGFKGRHTMVLPTSEEIHSKYEAIKNQLLQQSGIKSVAYSSRIPSGRLLDSQGGQVEVDGGIRNLDFRLADVHTDFDFLNTMEIPLIAGRNFDVKRASDSTEAFIINESAVKAVGWKSNDAAIGKKISYGGRNGHIIGVVKDFHFESLKQEIAPIIFMITNERYGSVVLKLDDKYKDETVKYLREQWSYLRPGYPFSYYFVDARFNELYAEEEQIAELVSYFSIIAVIIGVLGLFGLSSFTTEQRFKEIGIRKVMGASVPQILLLLSRNFTMLVVIGFLFAIPVAWFGMDKWLDTFAYHGNISVLSILLAGTLAVLIAWLTVGLQTVKAAKTNPVHALRHE